MNLRSFPSIDQFRHVVADVDHRATYVGQDSDDNPIYDLSRPRPQLQFRGTTKLHGSNLGIRYELHGANAGNYPQSRERFLLPDEQEKYADNFGFAGWAQGEGALEIAQLRSAALAAVEELGLTDIVTVHVYGELCGPRVNSKTAIGQLPERWMLLRALATNSAEDEHWLPLERVSHHWARIREEAGAGKSKVSFVTDFHLFHITVDFNDPAASLELLERLTLEVEACCPIARALGLEGLGEGIVWSCTDPSWGRLDFKTKGKKHKGTRSIKLVEITPEVLASRQEFVDAVLTDSRLEQGFDLIRVNHGKVTEDHIGIFLKWVGTDVMKEEADTLQTSGLERKDVMGLVNRQAKAWLTPRLAQF